MLAAQAPDLHEALQQVAEQGWSHVILDGKVFRTDRCADNHHQRERQHDRLLVLRETPRAFGGNVQAIMRPDGLPIWTSEVVTGHHHDLTAARDRTCSGALYWAASQLDLPTLADSRLRRRRPRRPRPRSSNPPTATSSPPTSGPTTRCIAAPRCSGERGFALLTGRWRALHHITASPSRIGDIVSAALVLTHFEHRYLRTSCRRSLLPAAGAWHRSSSLSSVIIWTLSGVV